MALSGIHLGIQPEVLRINVSAGADFTSTLRLSEDWPVGSTLSIVFSDASTWDATITAADAVFSEVAADVDTITHNTAVKLVYTDSGGTQVWAIGTVVRKDG